MIRSVQLAAAHVLNPGETPDVSFIPPLVRRRLSPLQKLYFALASTVEGERLAASAVFASRDGEDSLTRRIVESFNDDGSVSPHRFSASVYNAAPGLWSVHTKNRAPYTAIAAGDGTLEAGLLEALTGVAPSLFVYAEETNGGYGAAIRFDDTGNRRLELSAGDPSRPFLTFDALVAFLNGTTPRLSGRWLTVTQ